MLQPNQLWNYQSDRPVKRPRPVSANLKFEDFVDIRYWHKADIDPIRSDVRFRG